MDLGSGCGIASPVAEPADSVPGMTSTLIHRNLREDDAGAIADILGAIEADEPADENYSEDDIREELTAPGVDLDRGSIGILSDGELVAAGYLQISAPSAEWKSAQSAGVRPDHTGRGIGRQILQALESKAATIRDADAPGKPGQLKVWVEETRPRTAALVDAAGYQTWRHFFRMRSDLNRPVPGVPTPPGVEIRRFTGSDDEAVRLVSNEAFGDHWGSTPMDAQRWRAYMTDATSFRADQSWVALDHGEVLSFVMSSEFDADTAARGFRTGYIARVGTARRARGRGIGSALLSATLTGMAESGYREAELGVDAASPTGAGRIYERAGFVTVGRSRVVGKNF